jgi:heavy metal sensor kinase
VLAVVLLLFAGGLYSILTLSLLNAIDRDLEVTARQIADTARMQPAADGRGSTLSLTDLNLLVGPGLYGQVYDNEQRRVAYRSATLGDLTLPLDPEALRDLERGRTHHETRSVSGTRLRIYTAPIMADGRLRAIVQVAAPAAQLDQTQRQLLIILVVGGALAIAVSAVWGAFMARPVLRPIDEITRTALAISRTEDLSRRLEIRNASDEVGRLAATFNEMLARLEETFKTQRRFIADVSHELRTPLTTLRGNVELLSRGAGRDAEAHAQMLAAVQGEVDRMSRLVADLLLLAQADAGVPLESQPVELDTLLLDVYRQARTLDGRLDVRLGHEDQAMVQGDPDRLRQLLLNLVDNAVKYTPAGGRVTLSLQRDPGWVRVSVADTGIGIAPEHLRPGPSGVPLIFERFYRADKARSRSLGGTGLGLSIAYWIAEAHGGRIEVDTEAGRGSTFTVWLPEKQ